MKIILSGGGTLGPVVPLLAIAEIYKKHDPDAKFVWIGTKTGPERELVEKYNIPFIAIGAGKWRRYISLWNITDLFKLIISFFQCIYILWREKPSLLISAGGYVSVPLHWAAAFLAMPQWVHQQDVVPGFANKLMFPFAWKITTALKETVSIIPDKKTEWIGNPSRDLKVKSVVEARKRLNLPPEGPVIFALGGGTGSASINQLIVSAVPHWPKDWNIIHLVGKERPSELQEKASTVFSNYHVHQFFTNEMKDAFAVADVVIARAGFSTLTELASLSKAALILPMYETHQEENARVFNEQGGIILIRRTDDGIKVAQMVKDLVNNPERRIELQQKLHSILPAPDPEKIISIIKDTSKVLPI